MQRCLARLSAAIRDRRVVEIRYGGAWQVVHPHAVGHTGNLARSAAPARAASGC